MIDPYAPFDLTQEHCDHSISLPAPVERTRMMEQ